MKHIITILLCLLMTTGCAMQTEVNRQIAQSNAERFEAFKDGMVGCGEDAACKVALSMAFAGGLGQQQLYKEDSVTDYAKTFLPFAQLGLQGFGMYWYGQGNGASGDRASTFVKGDGNVFVTGNKMNYSTLGLETNFTRMFDGGYNRTFTGQQPISDSGLGPVEE